MPRCAVLFIHALTGLHPGSGTALGVVDLPVQRERHTQWPTIPGSSLKGVLREKCRRAASGEDDHLAVFGPKTANASDHAGAVSLTDARILAFPVRSLRGVFAWTTCPAALERLGRDLTLTGDRRGFPDVIPNVARDRVALPADSPLIAIRDRVMLEEFEFERVGDDIGAVADWIGAHATGDEATKARIKSHIAVLSDDAFSHFVRHATEVVARVGLDSERKTVKEGALFYEEFLPPETLFYSLAIAEDSRRKGHAKPAQEVLGYLTLHASGVIQIGGNETIGKGLCALRFDSGEGGAA